MLFSEISELLLDVAQSKAVPEPHRAENGTVDFLACSDILANYLMACEHTVQCSRCQVGKGTDV